MSLFYTPGLPGLGAYSGPGTPGSGPPWDDSWYGGGGAAMSAAGATVTADAILRIPTVYACVTNIAEDIGKSPFQMFEDQGDAGSRRAPELALDELLHHEPNRWQTAIEFREMVTAFAAVRQFGIAEIIPGKGRQRPGDVAEGTQLIPLHPDLVREETTETGRRRYIYRDPRQNYRDRPLMEDEVLVVRSKLGRSLVDLARESFGFELATEKFQGLLFSRGVTHSGVVSREKPWANADERKAFRGALNEYTAGGPRSGRPLLLEDGMTWSNSAMTMRDAQGIDSLRWGVLQTCRWFRMPAPKVQDWSDAHYANVEQAAIDYVVDTLLSWTIRWEQAVRRDLILDKARYFARLNLDALLRADTSARYAAYALAIQWGWMTRDEVRAKENLNPMGGLASDLNLDVGHGQPTEVAPAARAHLRLFASDAASRVVRREIAAVGKVEKAVGADPDAWRAGVDAAYKEHADFVAHALHLPEHVARQYVSEQRAALLAGGPAAMTTWDTDRVGHLADLALNQEAIAA